MAVDDEITQYAVRAADGDRRAAERFVATTKGPLHRLLTYLSDPGSAEDLVQETYLRAFGSLRGYEGRSPARTWLFAIARNVAADHLRARKRRPPTSATAVPESAATAPDHGRLVALHALVAGLDAERREAFVLTQLLGLSYAEAAEVCGCAVGTIRSRVFRARDELTRAVGGEEDQAVSSTR
ncbi:sigma-70 family RNA polymerase sigma factor [Prauserella endophytica]|uniref:RNA polymerase sigma factor n=1 Tax=Prauserella endophytica TaxID=1592324 RepID=A0ABY2RUQ7_9PSEU|nr:sigma-70 family RNA polymerase sigma factor [Prauserella endophytica]